MESSDLQVIRDRCQAASPGPWEATAGGIDGDEPDRWCVVRKEPPQFFIATIENGAPGDTLETERATAEFIANARTDVLRLLDEIERLKTVRN